jgi:hypothetical protein
MSDSDPIEHAFPELADIADDDLRTDTRRAWETAMTDNGVDDLKSLPWFPPAQRDLNLPDERLVPHVRDVTQGQASLQRRSSIVDTTSHSTR